MKPVPMGNHVLVRVTGEYVAPESGRIITIRSEDMLVWGTAEAVGPDVLDIRPGTGVLMRRGAGTTIGEYQLVPEGAIVATADSFVAQIKEKSDAGEA